VIYKHDVGSFKFFVKEIQDKSILEIWIDSESTIFFTLLQGAVIIFFFMKNPESNTAIRLINIRLYFRPF